MIDAELCAEMRRRLAAVVRPALAQTVRMSDGHLSVVAGSPEDVADAVLEACEFMAGFTAEGEDDEGSWVQFCDTWERAEEVTQTGRVAVHLYLWLPRVDDETDRQAE